MLKQLDKFVFRVQQYTVKQRADEAYYEQQLKDEKKDQEPKTERYFAYAEQKKYELDQHIKQTNKQVAGLKRDNARLRVEAKMTKYDFNEYKLNYKDRKIQYTIQKNANITLSNKLKA